jgi:putative tryptophan/tyrosine transport system substrate-binding protein
MKLKALWSIVWLATGICLTVPSHSQSPDRVPHVGWLSYGKVDEIGLGRNKYYQAFLAGLRERGYIPGNNVIVDVVGTQSLDDWDFDEPIRDLIRRKVKVFSVAGPPQIRAAMRATSTIPIVAITCDRADRMARSLARPGGNVTGQACVSRDIAAKRLEYLKEMVPGLSRVAVLFNASEQEKWDELRDSEAAAKALGLELQAIEVRDGSGFEKALTSILEARPQALLVFDESLTYFKIPRLAAFAEQNRLPTMYGFREFADAGGLVSYGSNLLAIHRRQAYFVDKILKGEKPSDIPIEQPTRFELVINARTAKTIGLVLPALILSRADEVIE